MQTKHLAKLPEHTNGTTKVTAHYYYCDLFNPILAQGTILSTNPINHFSDLH